MRAARRRAELPRPCLRRIAQPGNDLGCEVSPSCPGYHRRWRRAAAGEFGELCRWKAFASHQLETCSASRARPERARAFARVTLPPAVPLATAHVRLRRFPCDVSASGHRDGRPAQPSRRAGQPETDRAPDVAILRVAYDRKTLPLNLHGLKDRGVRRRLRPAIGWPRRAGAPDPIRWIAGKRLEFRIGPARGRSAPRESPSRTTDAEAQVAAASGKGSGPRRRRASSETPTPCWQRTPGADLHMYGTLWLLTAGETRKTKRVRLFTQFVARRLAAYAPLLKGHHATDAPQVAGDWRRRQGGANSRCCLQSRTTVRTKAA